MFAIHDSVTPVELNRLIQNKSISNKINVGDRGLGQARAPELFVFLHSSIAKHAPRLRPCLNIMASKFTSGCRSEVPGEPARKGPIFSLIWVRACIVTVMHEYKNVRLYNKVHTN